MKIEREIEDRLMINKSIFLDLKNTTFKAVKPIKQTNYYFDTPSLELKKNHIVLRARKINNKNIEYTLKAKGEKTKGDIEHTFIILKINKKHINLPIEFKSLIEERNIDITKIRYITKLTTTRYEKRTNNALLVLDKNKYSHITDYNIEVEANDFDVAHKYVLDIAKTYHLEYNEKYISKSSRALKRNK